MGMDLLPAVLAAIALAIGPALAYTFYLIGKSKPHWKAFFFGWGGWLLAYIARSIPIAILTLLLAISAETDIATLLIYVAILSILAGLFEEGFRYLFLDQREEIRKNRKSVLTFGLGWGIGEAIIIYVPAIVLLLFMELPAMTLFDLLPGAIERNLAILSHIAFTFIVLRTFSGKEKEYKFVILAMILHFLINMIAVASLLLTQNAWLTEGVIALMTGLNLLIAYKLGSLKK